MSKQSKKTTRPAAHPWVIDGIDYGPAIAAAGDLAAWAFELAATDVADWPEGRRRVRNARRYVLARLRGKHPRSTPFEDVLFTAGLLARIFEADIGLGMSDVVGILDDFGLPTEVVPLWPRAQRQANAPRRPIAPLRPRPAAAIALPEPCEECGGFPRFRNAA
ncbi:MAG: hypothetical protein KC464_25430 [Myxococcales bacterium]|nr:hypothetical protein [Myxococcales bacterium]